MSEPVAGSVSRESKASMQEPSSRPFVMVAHQAQTHAAFMGRALALAESLGPGEFVINLCGDRAKFLTLFAAAILAGRTTVLPQSRSRPVLAGLAAEFAGAQLLDDQWVEAAGVEDAGNQAAGIHEPRVSTSAGVDRKFHSDLNAVDPDFIPIIACTSGTTGQPRQHRKRWGALLQTTHLNHEAITEAIGADWTGALPWITATVPTQHMYGMELTGLLPLLQPVGINGAHPLLPLDVANALAQTPEPRVLVSTPAHLRVLVESGVPLPAVALTLCATAPLDQALAARVEAATGGVLLDMFGSTETCIFATRHAAREACWTPYPGVTITPESTQTVIAAPWLDKPQSLQDLMQVMPDRTFSVLGRSADLVNVAGKRASLADITRLLLGTPGVLDAVVFQPEDAESASIGRLAAFVVAPGLEAARLRQTLAESLDPVFVPRPLQIVDALPRMPSGKLPRDAVLSLFRRSQTPAAE